MDVLNVVIPFVISVLIQPKVYSKSEPQPPNVSPDHNVKIISTDPLLKEKKSLLMIKDTKLNHTNVNQKKSINV